MYTLTINFNKLEEYGINLNELLVMLKIKDPNVNCSYTPLQYVTVREKTLINTTRNGLDVLTPEGERILKSFLTSRDDTVSDLADAMREIYPPGKKGNIYYWRGTTQDIVKKLQLFFNKYGTNFSDEAILNATRNYYDSFEDKNRDKAMMLLKYFIEKQGSSTLLSYLEGIDDVNSTEINYGSGQLL